MKLLIAAAAALALSGCGLPPALTIASYALDGMSLLSTGKSVSDHAISAAAKQDCAVWRVITDDDVCRDYERGGKSRMALAAEKWERGGEIVGLTDAEPFIVRGGRSSPVVLALVDPVILPQFDNGGSAATRANDSGLGIRLPPGPIAASFVAITRAPGPDNLTHALLDEPWRLPVGSAPVDAVERAHRKLDAPRLVAPAFVQDAAARPAAGALDKVLVLGSFTQLDNAKRAARQWSEFSPTIIQARVGGTVHHRVIVGALSGDVARRQRQLASLGQLAWAADVCADDSAGGSCVKLPAVLRH